MKPSELKAGKGQLREADKPVPVNISREANPPITAKETENCKHAICLWHHGLIARHPSPSEYGHVFFCPIGEQYWRYQDPDKRWGWSKKLRPIQYPNDASLA